MYVCHCFGVTEDQVRRHVDAGACTPRQVASACKAGTDCGSCVRRIQALLGRGTCPRRELVDQGRPAFTSDPALASEPAAASARPGDRSNGRPAPALTPAHAAVRAPAVAPASAYAQDAPPTESAPAGTEAALDDAA